MQGHRACRVQNGGAMSSIFFSRVFVFCWVKETERERVDEEPWTPKTADLVIVCTRGKPSRNCPGTAVSVFGRKSGRIRPLCRASRRKLSSSREKAYSVVRISVRQGTTREAVSILVSKGGEVFASPPGCEPRVTVCLQQN